MKFRVTEADFIRRSNSIHNFAYDYTFCEYNGTNKKVKIICPKHGEFEQKAAAHLRGKGCKKCGIERMKYTDRHRPKTSKYKGVSWIESIKKWDASLYYNGKQYAIGRFNSEAEAYVAVEAARAVHKPIKNIENLPFEEWVDFSFMGARYAVSNKGRVKSYNWKNTGTTGLLILQINPFGYYTIHIKGKTVFVHNLVANAFIGTKNGYVNHKDGNKLNNYPSNLEYISNRANVCHAIITGDKKTTPIGAHRRKRDGMWVSEIKIGNDRIWLGAYSTPEEASNRYINAIKEFGLIEDYSYITGLLGISI